MMKRLPDWRTRFDAAIDDMKAKPFAWGEHDCGPGLVGRMVLAMTGEDVARRYRGKYRTARGALGVMRRAGFNTLADMAGSVLPEVHPSRARVGDIAAFPADTAFGYALGVVNGERVYVLREDGLGTMDLLSATRAFRVG
jgi:hypothetical protein